MLDVLLSITAAVLYSIASVMLYQSLLSDQSRTRWLSLALIAALIHLVVTVKLTGVPVALHLPFFTALSVTGLAMVLLLLALCLSQPADYLGLMVLPLAAVVLLAGQIHQGNQSAIDASIKFHVLSSLIAYALLALAAAQALLVALQRHYLNQHKPTGFVRVLPALQRTESLLFALLGAGFVMLTVSLATGWAYLDNMFSQQVAHKTVLSCMAWAVFGLLLFGRWQFGWRGKRAINWTLAGFSLLLVAYFGSKLVLELILKR
ncbi:MAG: cytochrome c biogenesis protein CcsA [Gammaproteobacteria bacterium]|nr:cytochrome c biogenesis protein CcsA [Gammaproteobacteria bacterium]